MMSRFRPCPLSLAIFCSLLPVLGWSQTAPAPNDGFSVLMQQADLWHERNRLEMARQVLDRALLVRPNAEEALYRMALYAQDKQAREQWIERLRAASPDSHYLASLNSADRRAQIDDRALAGVRQLASRGRTQEAIKGYRALLNGGIPSPDLASEYYQTLAGDAASWKEGVEGLKRLAEDQPTDAGVQLAYARALTYREETRRQGIERLAELAPASASASGAWRQALLWLSPTEADRARYEQYMAANPQDQEIGQQYEAAIARAQTAKQGQERGAGFTALSKGETGTALANFRAAISKNPKDADAWGGLGVVQLRNQQYAQAAASLSKAIKLAPKKKQQWAAALRDANFYSRLADARKARDTGDIAGAEKQVRQLKPGTADQRRTANLLLGELLLRDERPAEAEAVYRQNLQASPNDSASQLGLYNSLLGQRNIQGAAQLLRSTPALAKQSLVSVERIEAQALRERGESLEKNGDVDGAAQLYAEALAMAPADPWVRLAYARLLNVQGEAEQAERMMAPLGQRPDAESRHAAALLASEQSRWDEASELLAQVPPAQQTLEMRELQQRVAVNERIATARQQASTGNPVVARQALRELYDNAPKDLAARGRIAEALADLGEPGLALSLVRDDLSDAVDGPVQGYLGHLAVLGKTGQSAEADVLMRRLAQRGELTVQDQASIDQLRDGLAITQADNQRLQGDFAGAYDTLMARINVSPANDELLLAMGRLYNDGKMYPAAASVYNHVLQRQPNHAEAIEGGVNAALGNKQPDRAHALLASATGMDEPRRLFLRARVAQAKGQHQQARILLENAQRQQQRRLAGQGSLLLAQGARPFVQTNPFRKASDPSAYSVAAVDSSLPAYLQRQPFAGAATQSAPVGDPLLRDIGRALTEVSEQTASFVSVGGQLRARDGEAGLSKLTEFSAPMTLSTVPLESGRLEVTATPVSLSAGTASDSAATRFGSHAIPAGLVNGSANAFRLAVETDYQTRLQVRTQQVFQSENRALTAQERAELLSTSREEMASGIQQGLIAEGLSVEDATAVRNNLLANTPEKLLDSYKPGSQNEAGVALNLAYKGDLISADIGTTPLGFSQTNIVGGIKVSPKLGQNGRLDIDVHRRAVTDSLLSYAGSKDPLTGKEWGAVTRTGAGIQYSYDNGSAGFYVGGKADRYAGKNVVDNTGLGFSSGIYVRPIQEQDRQLQVGVGLDWMSFDKNLGFYTSGHGGYFSPENYVGVSLPVQWTQSFGKRWGMQVGGALGYQSYSQDSADYFPNDSEMQGALEAVQAVVSEYVTDNSVQVQSRYSGQSESGMAVNLRGKLEYKLGDQTKVGGALGYDSFGEYKETTGSIYIKHNLEKLP
ncbi:cellulose biosynthesis protein BcsC [Stutzerimonas stutzeri]|uniref:cellulose biosynthesis protein BcsC n=1 Tax=Stutzerimonas stutzeri TaxID=316 RepID=UPI0015E29718|nr:cellulose biosynthesis protein BcsC [Stutzerimonas stutzeri]MBA1276456.1 tetratricopeptide repeat protein [Stutzerimonas stutzeri]